MSRLDKLPSIERGTQKRKTFSFTLTIGNIFALGVSFLLVCVWLFFMGVLLGRGYVPEKSVPQLEVLMPQASTQNTVVIDVDEAAMADSEEEQGSPYVENLRPMAPQELEYHESLKSDVALSLPAQTRKKATQNETSSGVRKRKATVDPEVTLGQSSATNGQGGSAALAEQSTSQRSVEQNKKQDVDVRADKNAKKTSPELNKAKLDKAQKSASATDAKQRKEQKTIANADKKAKSQGNSTSLSKKANTSADSKDKSSVDKTKKASKAGEKIYKYEFQVAASSEKAEAEALVKKLKSIKLQSRIGTSTDKNNKRWYQVIILFEGAESEVQPLKNKLKTIKINSLIRRSKVLVR